MFENIYYLFAIVAIVVPGAWWIITNINELKGEIDPIKSDMSKLSLKTDRVDEKYNDIKSDLRVIQTSQSHIASQLTSLLEKQDRRIEKVENVMEQLKKDSAAHDNCMLRAHQADIIQAIKEKN